MLKRQNVCSSHNWLIKICTLVTIAILLSIPAINSAADNYWNVVSGDWSDTNPYPWSLGTEPTSSDYAYIQNGGTATITQIGEQCKYLYLGATGTGNSGTIEMTGGDLTTSYYEYIGYSGTGIFTQSGGTNSSNLDLGYNSGVSGSYNLSGTGQVSAYNEYIGYSGTGTFTQTDGTNSTTYIYLGNKTNSSGTYNVSDAGNLSAKYEYIGYSGTGTFNQTGGTNSITNFLYLGYNSGSSGIYTLSGGTLSTTNIYVGYSGTGRFEWFYNGLTTTNLRLGSSGTLAVGFDFDIASLTSCSLFNGSTLTGLSSATLEITNSATATQSGNTSASIGYLKLGTKTGIGTYNLSGTGQLSTYNEYIGYSGTGTFTQTGGSNSLSVLFFGLDSGSSGTYDLSGKGQLSTTNNEYIGYSGTGTFTQTGGTNSISSYLYLGYNSGSTGSYYLNDAGKLSAATSEYIGYYGTGTFNQAGGTNSTTNSLYLGYKSGSTGTYTLSGGTLSATNIYVGYSGTGRFEWFYNGLTTTNLILSSSGTLAMGFDFDMAALTSGTLFNGTTLNGLSSVTLEITNGATATQSGITSASIKYLTIGSSTGNGTYKLNSTALLSSNTEYIGYSGTGTFTQTSGTNSLSTLYLGYNSGSSGTYNLNATGQLATSVEYIGYSGMGTFTQTGGTNKILSYRNPPYLYIGYNSGSSGTYNLNVTGQLSAYNEYIGYSGMGKFTQTGGTNTISSSNYLYIGYNSGSSGTYDLSGTGQLSTTCNEYIGYSGTGSFTQTGGTNSILDLVLGLCLGYNSGSSGTYNLSNSGQLSAYKEYIGYSGTGTFTQTGGMNTISLYNALNLGYYSGSSGTYNLNGGTLITKSISQGSGTAAFNFGGGTLQASDGFNCSMPMTLTGEGGNANINASSWIILYGVLSGDGGLNKLGLGTLDLDASNTYKGGTMFSCGYISASSLTNFGTGKLTFDGGGLLFTGTYDPSSLGITINAGGANFNTNNHSISFATALSGTGGLNKLGLGTLTLSDSNSYKGNTVINTGTLTLTSTGSIDSSPIIDVMSGATFDVSAKSSFSLGGTQTLMGGGNVTAAAGSHIAPGDSAGTLTISGNLTLNDGALLDFELASSTSASDKISMISSTLYLNGLDFSDFTFTALNGFGKGTYTLIDAKTISGSLGSNLTGTIDGFTATLSTYNNDLILTVVPEPGTWMLLATGCLAFFIGKRMGRRDKG
jgi:fibronectin-binding autotransporter adhesin